VLVLTREVGQTIVIGNDIRITVVQVKGDQARIGIDAPRSVPVNRLEVFEELEGANAAAADSSPSDLEFLQSMRRPKP
jgi:carbon storage regulator